MKVVTRHIVVMGVSGCGKSTVAEGISKAASLPFAEADRFHPAANIEKMAAGIPLEDADRWGWLGALSAWMAAQAREGRSTVIACSALKRSYRDLLRKGPPSLDFVHLAGDPDVIRARMGRRKGHFMPTSLLESQLATLEPLAPDESGIVIDLALPAAEIIDRAVLELGLTP